MSHPHVVIPADGNNGLFAAALGTVANWTLTLFAGYETTTILALVSTAVTFYCAIPSIFRTTTFIQQKIAEHKGKKKGKSKS